MNFVGHCPLSHSVLDIKTLAMAQENHLSWSREKAYAKARG